jgi:hypothetical protein
VRSKGVIARLLSRAEQASSVTDYRGVPTHACPCGQKVFNILACFEDYEISLYTLDANCSECGALVTAPTPLDRV